MSDISWARRFYWSLRRELWEIPAVFVASVAAGFIVVVAHVITTLRGGAQMSAPTMAIGAVMAATYLVALFYSLDTLYSERKDRSILFWKSLPVSDTTTIAAKFAIPMLVAPVVAFIVTEVTLVVLMLVGAAHAPFMRTSVLVLYHLVTVHALWWAPLFGWLFMISAFANRTPLVWATLPVFAFVLLEKMLLGTAYFETLLKTRFGVTPEAMVPKGNFPTDPMVDMTPLRFLSDPGLWIGFGLALLFLAVAVRLRRQRGPI
jgi:ABC-2 type transport system permease protein